MKDHRRYTMGQSPQRDVKSIIRQLEGRSTVPINELNQMIDELSPDLFDLLFEELEHAGIEVLFDEKQHLLEDDIDIEATVSIEELRELENSPLPDSISVLKKQSLPSQPIPISLETILAAQRGAKEAIQKVFASHLNIALKWSRLMKDRGLSCSDLLQEGNIAILETLHRYNPKKSISFRAATEWRIKNRMAQAIAQKRRFIRLPLSIQNELRNVFRAESQLHQKLGRKPTDDEWAAAANITPNRLRELLVLAPTPVSIDQSSQPDQSGMGEFLRSIGEDAFALSDDEEILKLLQRGLENLEATEKRVIELRFGLGSANAHSIERTSNILGISKTMVTKLENSGLSKLHSFLSHLLDDF